MKLKTACIVLHRSFAAMSETAMDVGSGCIGSGCVSAIHAL